MTLAHIRRTRLGARRPIKVWLVQHYPMDNSRVGVFTSLGKVNKLLEKLQADGDKKSDFSVHEMILNVPHEDYI